MPKVSKPCAGCGAAFESWPNHNRKFCSRPCAAKHGNAGRKVGDWKSGPIAIQCDHCGGTFTRWPSQRRSGGKFCSLACFNAARRDRRTYECAACGKVRTVKAGMPNRFCSAACWYEHGLERSSPEQRKENAAAARRKRYAAMRGRKSESYTLAEIGERDGWRCGICGRKVGKRLRWPHVRSASIDHIVPISLGGDDVRANVQLAHYGCNASKNNRALPQGEQLRLIG